MIKFLKLSQSTRRIAIGNSVVFLMILLIFNVILLSLLNHIFVEYLDNRLDHELERVVNTMEIRNDSIAVKSFTELHENDFMEVSENPFFLRVYAKNGVLLLESNNCKYVDLPIILHLKEMNASDHYSFKNKAYQIRISIKKVYNKNSNDYAFFFLATSSEIIGNTISRLLLLNIILMPFLIIIIFLINLLLAKSYSRNLNEIITLVEKSSAENIYYRIHYDAKPNDELGRLRDAVNDLLSRIGDYISNMNQFTHNASHQLMTPLTAMKTELEFLLKKNRTISEYEENLKIISSQSDKMISVTKALLLIARMETRGILTKKLINVGSSIRFLIDTFYIKENIMLSMKENIYIKGEEEYFHIVCQNLIENAIKFSPPGSVIKINMEVIAGNILILFEDEGPGINDDEKLKIFERFYRSKFSEQNGIDGFGLGLCIVNTIIKKMDGLVYVKDNNPHGSVFVISFPHLRLK